MGPWLLRVPAGPETLVQLFVSVVDIVCAGACLYVLLDASGLPFLVFLSVYVVALLGGAVSQVPGGLGVFETVMILGLRNRVAAETLTAAIIAYRGIYHLLPLVLAVAILAAHETRERLPSLVSAVRQVTSWSAKLVPSVLAGVSFLAGLVLLLSIATPGAATRLQLVKAIVPLPLVEASTLLASVIGLGLLVVARGLYRKLNGAYALASTLCLAGAVLSLIKGFDWREALILFLSALVLFLCRREFYRKTALMDSPFTAGWVVSILGSVGAMYWLVLFSYKHVEYADMLWWKFGYHAEASRSLRAALLVTVVLFFFGVSRLLHPPRQRPPPLAPAELDRAEAVVRGQDRADANLALIGDKQLLFSPDSDAFLMYGVHGSSWVALGDPVGSALAADELAWQFRELADREGGRVAFYQTRTETLPLYLDMGLTPLKLGEEAVVDLESFSLEGAGRKGLRYSLRRGERDGLRFEILPREVVPARIDELRTISDQWLALKTTREKHFSLGAFSPEYLARFQVGTVMHGGRMAAFANLFTTDMRAEASIDLMRHVADAPDQTMTFLFVNLMLHFKSAGFRRLALGMAPLSGMEMHPLAPLWHRFGHLIYNRGERFYNFQGLREFKEKFDPLWEPRYLATSGGRSPLLLVTDIAALIAGGAHGVIAK
ncbi:MAG: bifunctional lysylphosphatidylglycerol flippase/synthetase MprF [Chromatiales bacterium]